MPNELEDLADVPPERFVAARDELVKRLKADGKGTEAAEVKKLRKPTVNQWVADQVRRHHAEEVEALRAALSNVAAAQETAITRGDRGALAEATAQRRDAMRALGRAVDDVLAAGERPVHHRDEVVGAIEAVRRRRGPSHGTSVSAATSRSPSERRETAARPRRRAAGGKCRLDRSGRGPRRPST